MRLSSWLLYLSNFLDYDRSDFAPIFVDIYFFRAKSFANQRERLQGRLFSSRLLIVSGLSCLFFDCLFMKNTNSLISALKLNT